MRVYIAGKLNDDAVGYVSNMHRMIKTAGEVKKAGYSVFVPCIDILMGLQLGWTSYEEYFNNSQEWLDASDALFLTPGWETSPGTAKEIERAHNQGIPVFNNIVEMDMYFIDIRTELDAKNNTPRRMTLGDFKKQTLEFPDDMPMVLLDISDDTATGTYNIDSVNSEIAMTANGAKEVITVNFNV